MTEDPKNPNADCTEPEIIEDETHDGKFGNCTYTFKGSFISYFSCKVMEKIFWDKDGKPKTSCASCTFTSWRIFNGNLANSSRCYGGKLKKCPPCNERCKKEGEYIIEFD